MRVEVNIAEDVEKKRHVSLGMLKQWQRINGLEEYYSGYCQKGERGGDHEGVREMM